MARPIAARSQVQRKSAFRQGVIKNLSAHKCWWKSANTSQDAPFFSRVLPDTSAGLAVPND
jgi:hypothetical protein